MKFSTVTGIGSLIAEPLAALCLKDLGAIVQCDGNVGVSVTSRLHTDVPGTDLP